MIIDFHCHVGQCDKLVNFQVTKEIPLDYVVSAQEEAGVGASVLLPMPTAYREDLEVRNGFMMTIKNERFFPFIWLNPYFLRTYDNRGIDEAFIIRKIRENKIYGIKVHPVCDGYYPEAWLMAPIFEIASACSVPVLWHTGWGSFGEARYVEYSAKFYPGVKVVIGHMVDNSAPDIAYRYDNVYLETSYCSGPRRLAGAVNLLGSEKILFGSDFPVNDMVFQKTMVLRTKISTQEKENILGNNARSLLGI